MESISIYKCAIGLDVHQKQVTATVVIDQAAAPVKWKQRYLGHSNMIEGPRQEG